MIQELLFLLNFFKLKTSTNLWHTHDLYKYEAQFQSFGENDLVAAAKFRQINNWRGQMNAKGPYCENKHINRHCAFHALMQVGPIKTSASAGGSKVECLFWCARRTENAASRARRGIQTCEA